MLLQASRRVLHRYCGACDAISPASRFECVNPWRSAWIGAPDPTYRCPSCKCTREAGCFPFIKESV